ncbi:MAG: 23S rRNA (uracil(1939)-C(5))-methyltransferase RlmD, partial [Gammaproteobacteria bacterium]|nr:23S rRNA (uracil(1939)-C(5))-methyltransferase RlmD [Gammaproteobacteria bacterium]
GPTDFVQINAAINSEMIDAIVTQLDPAADDQVLDLFCGIGNITLPLARYAGRVTGIEGAAPQVERARANAAANGLGNTDFAVADLSTDIVSMPFMQKHWDRLVLDPPRSGAAAVCENIDRINPGRIVYVSCHPATLARDIATLVAAGYQLESAGVMDMFPHTAHVESMAVLSRAK